MDKIELEEQASASEGSKADISLPGPNACSSSLLNLHFMVELNIKDGFTAKYMHQQSTEKITATRNIILSLFFIIV